LFYFVSMSILSASPLRPARDVETFKQAFLDAAARPVTEIAPASAGDGAAAFGFALGWLCAARPAQPEPGQPEPAQPEPAQPAGLTLIAAPDETSAEIGVAYPPGLSRFGLDPARIVHVRARKLKDALWACEQALGLSRAHALCIVPQNARLTLTATRRLHLAAEKSGARCVLLRFDPLSPSAAWTRWNVTGAPSHGVGAELGRPCFAVSLARRRSGQSGQRWLLEWNAHEHAFADTSRNAHIDAGCEVAGLVAAASAHRPAETYRRRAG
jgi:protein ImuA